MGRIHVRLFLIDARKHEFDRVVAHSSIDPQHLAVVLVTGDKHQVLRLGVNDQVEHVGPVDKIDEVLALGNLAHVSNFDSRSSKT